MTAHPSAARGLGALLAALILTGCGGGGTGTTDGAGSEGTPAVVVRVVDGDTLIADLDDGGEERVRMLGIDTPEAGERPECGAAAATEHLRSLLPDGTDVRLVGDPTQDDRDVYDRPLRFVHRDSDDLDVNLAQVESGHAEVYIFRDQPFTRAEQYLAAEREAARAGRGALTACRR
ncbi:MAG: thermonuclease family protein [Nocardioides sp.]|nr:thermonuclease family protein [Nocardioides sp.]